MAKTNTKRARSLRKPAKKNAISKKMPKASMTVKKVPKKKSSLNLKK